MPLTLLVVSFLLSVSCVFIFRKLSAGSPRLLDIPNERSSHTSPVTHGAGIAVVLTVLGTYAATTGISANRSYIIAALAIALVSFLDDLFTVPIPVRLALHFLAAGLFVYFSGAYIEIAIPWSNASFQFGTSSAWITIIFIVWTINAFNFMDGIDGIAGLQGIAAAFGWMVLGIVMGIQSYSSLGTILLGACAGFLVFNWHPAKVFMGDVGSTFLGFSFAVLPLIGTTHSSNHQPSSLMAAIIFLWLFMYDTVLTRLRHALLLKPVWKPHRDHLYQRIVAGGASHQLVASYFGIVAIGTAGAFSFAGTIGLVPLILILSISPVGLLAWSWKKRLT